MNKVASQSSTYGDGIASLAVDGNTTGNSPWNLSSGDADLQHTQNQVEPWWEVDLGESFQIEEVNIFNRSSGPQDRLTNFYVFMSEQPFAPNASTTELENAAGVEYSYYPGTVGNQVTLGFNARARYVRIQLGGTGTLHVAEVEVIGCLLVDPCENAQPVTIAPAGPFYENAGIQTLSASPSGGIWEGTANSNGTFDPSVGPGSYPVDYTYTDANGCTQTASRNIIVNAAPTGGNCSNGLNLAFNKSASQSSTYGDGVASLAIDGDTLGTSPWNLSSGDANLQHTNDQAQPWWQVDLGASYSLSTLEIFNRTNNSQDRLANFYVLVSADPFPANASLVSLLNDPGVYQDLIGGPVGLSETISLNQVGRYVRIQLAGTGILHMAEVNVYGSSNLALNKAATQSTTYGDGLASLAVDGNTTGSQPWILSGNPADLQHSTSQNQPWWQVDLGSQAEINQVNIYNRSDCCQSRLNDFQILASPNSFPVGASLSDLLSDPQISRHHFAGNAGQIESIPFLANARYVRIQMQGSNETLHMAEVEVMGCSATSGGGSSSQRLSSSNSSSFNPSIHGMNIFPNPSSGNVVLEINTEEKGDFKVQVKDMLGRTIQTLNFTKKNFYMQTKLNVSKLSNGVYLLDVEGPNFHEVQRLQIQ